MIAATRIGRNEALLPSAAAPSSVAASSIAIETWLSAEFDLPAIHEHPRLKLVFAALRFKILPSNPKTGDEANDHGTSSAQGDTVALYRDATIYLPEDWNGSTPAELSVLVHEMVHHFQNVLGLKYLPTRA